MVLPSPSSATPSGMTIVSVVTQLASNVQSSDVFVNSQGPTHSPLRHD